MENETSHDTRMAPPGSVPGATDSTILMLDALLTLLWLVKAEAVQALQTLPPLFHLNLYRLPALLLTWISFGVLVACSVYALSQNPVFAAGSFFLLQLGLTLLLERRFRRLHDRMNFPESRKGLAALQASLQQRFEHEGD